MTIKEIKGDHHILVNKNEFGEIKENITNKLKSDHKTIEQMLGQSNYPCDTDKSRVEITVVDLKNGKYEMGLSANRGKKGYINGSYKVIFENDDEISSWDKRDNYDFRNKIIDCIFLGKNVPSVVKS